VPKEFKSAAEDAHHSPGPIEFHGGELNESGIDSA